MPLTPDEIAEKEFTFGLRGYDHDEVRAFLLLVAANYGEHGATASAPDAAAHVGAAASQAAAILQKAHDEAAQIHQSATAEGEMIRARTRTLLAAAQDESLRLVAEAHARIDRRGAASGASPVSGDATGSTIEQLGEEISVMVQARDEVLRQLQEVQARVDHAVQTAEADPVLRRPAVARAT